MLNPDVRYAIRTNPTCPAELAEALAHAPDALVARGDVIKDRQHDRTSIVRIALGERMLCVKRYNRMSALHTAAHLFLPTRAARCMRNAALLEAAGLRTPRVLAMTEERIGPCHLRSWLVTEWIPGKTLKDWVSTRAVNDEAIQIVVRSVAVMWRTLGERRIEHGDMKATNFIVDDEHNLWLVDLDGMRTHTLAWTYRPRRAKDRERFLRNWQDRPELAQVFRDALDTAGEHA